MTLLARGRRSADRKKTHKFCVILSAALSLFVFACADFENAFIEPSLNRFVYLLACLLGGYAYYQLIWSIKCTPSIYILRKDRVCVKTLTGTHFYCTNERQKYYLMRQSGFVRLANGKFLSIVFPDRKALIQNLDRENIAHTGSLPVMATYSIFFAALIALSWIQTRLGDSAFLGALILFFAGVWQLTPNRPDRSIKKNSLRRTKERFIRTANQLAIVTATVLLIQLSDMPLSEADQEYTAAEADFDEAPSAAHLSRLRELVQRSGKGHHLNNLAWRLLTAPSKDLRDFPLALELSEKAVALEPANLNHRDTYACALSGNQRMPEAIAIAKRLGSKKRVAAFTKGEPCEDARLYRRSPASVNVPSTDDR